MQKNTGAKLFTLSYGNRTSAPITYINNNNASLASRILNALTGPVSPTEPGMLPPGSVTVQATSATNVVITFTGALANANVQQLVASGMSTGGQALVTTTIEGTSNTTQIVNIGGSGGSGIETFTLSYGGQSTAPFVWTAGIGPTAIDGVLGVVKAYTTRVGNGPLPTEAEPALSERLRTVGGEFGATTGRPRRCGWFDASVVRYAARVNGLTGLAVTKLDVLDHFDTIPVGTGYKLDGGECAEMPADVEQLARVRPVYEELEGWNADTGGARKVDELPRQARAYLDRIQELSGVPIRYVSVGTRRDQIIELQ